MHRLLKLYFIMLMIFSLELMASENSIGVKLGETLYKDVRDVYSLENKHKDEGEHYVRMPVIIEKSFNNFSDLAFSELSKINEIHLIFNMYKKTIEGVQIYINDIDFNANHKILEKKYEYLSGCSKNCRFYYGIFEDNKNDIIISIVKDSHTNNGWVSYRTRIYQIEFDKIIQEFSKEG